MQYAPSHSAQEVDSFRFELIHQSTKSRARVGRIHTPHGIIDTPSFVAVGTNGTMKSLDTVRVDELGLQLMFCNTFHLLLQPGADIVEQAGGLHPFMNRKMPLITDSGGFQVFSLAYGGYTSELKSSGQKKGDGCVLKINEDGVLFRSYRDGTKFLLTPESSIEAQKKLGADIIIPFDELPPYHMDPSALKRSLDRTHRWERRSLDAHLANPKGQAMYAVVHGGVDHNLRKESANVLTQMPFDGYAIGGSVGKNREEMYDMLSCVMPRLPDDKPNHLLGIGDLPSIQMAIPLGVDTFDSSYPTKSARHGTLFNDWGGIRVSQGKYKARFEAPDETCDCHTCHNYTLAYLHHLFKAKELAFMTLATIHNVRYMVRLMERYRQAILENQL